MPCEALAWPCGRLPPVIRCDRVTISSFTRVEVIDGAGAIVGLSNPVWPLREPPPYGIPAARAC